MNAHTAPQGGNEARRIRASSSGRALDENQGAFSSMHFCTKALRRSTRTL